MKTVVLTSDLRSWLLKGFFHQWGKYVSAQPGGDELLKVEVAGFSDPGNLPSNVTFESIGKFEDFPLDRWSNALIKYLQSVKDDLVLIMLEDYWLVRRVDLPAIHQAELYMEAHPNIARFDLTTDRIFNRSSQFVEPFGHLDICECKGDYSLSFQASIYNRRLLLDVLRLNESPWNTELRGSDRLNHLPYRVVGSYQWPMNYMIVVNKGEFDRKGRWMYPARSLSPGDWKELEQSGCLETLEVKHG